MAYPKHQCVAATVTLLMAPRCFSSCMCVCKLSVFVPPLLLLIAPRINGVFPSHQAALILGICLIGLVCCAATLTSSAGFPQLGVAFTTQLI